VIIHLNGELIPLDRARISPFDRGFLFGDGIYEGLRAFGGRIVGMPLHIERLRSGLREARIPWDAAALGPLSQALLKANNLADAFIYWQVTRGVPAPGQPVRTRILSGAIRPTVFGYCVGAPPLSSYTTPPIKTAITTPDLRWLRGRIKSTSLMGSVISAAEADEAGAEDAIMVRDGLAAEGTAANLFVAIPGPDGQTQIATPSLESVPILEGVTRDILLRAMPQIASRPVTERELLSATEVMLAGTMTMVTSIVILNGRPVGDGTPGPIARQLLQTLVREIGRGA